MNDTIQLFTYKQNRKIYILPNHWVYKRKNWFTDKLWWALHRLKCLENSSEETITVQTVHINKKSVADKILQCMKGMHINYMKPTKVYMGEDEFDEHISGEYAKGHYINFDVKMGYNSTIFDLPVTVVPHMKGILVV